MKVTEVIENLRSWRHQRGDDELSCETVVDYFSCCREIAEIISSHHVGMFGGKGKTVQIDETFLTKRKYHRGRVTEQMSIVVLEKQYRYDRGSQIMQFFEDMGRVYPGWIDGQKKDILNLKNLELSPEDVNSIEDYLPPFKRQREMPIDEEFDFENSSEDDADNPLFDSS
ncbi:hypothetical protein RF55_16241 [Lasius niger]|uniref:Uncharacterized protein n=1 Tax=Lasius niger TaxID=67767 RepID=A0A0J7K4N7_LASNI|nr:hypothetical protein RF55_16241 [Lasius niger]